MMATGRNIFPRLFFLFAIILFFLFFLPTPSAQAGSAGHLQNTVILWTDRSELKAVSLVSVQPGQKSIGIIAIPVITRVDNNPPDTLAGLYQHGGRRGLTGYLEKRFHTPIQTYFCIDQRALFLASEIVGPINMPGRRTTLLNVFEGTYTEQRLDLQVEIRALAKALLEPEILVKIPHLIWILTTNVETNLSPAHFLAFYQALRGGGPDILRKEALPGRICLTGGASYWDVAPEAWQEVFTSVQKP